MTDIEGLCRSAFSAEYYNGRPKAQSLHTSAIEKLKEVIKNAGFFDGETKRVAKIRIGIHQDRLNCLNSQRSAQSPFLLTVAEDAKNGMNPVLNTSLPNVIYNIHAHRDQNPLKSTHWCYIEIKDSTSTETLYICEALKKRKVQIPQVKFCRVSEYPAPCYVTNVTPVTDKGLPQILGRPLKHMSGSGGAIEELPDQDPPHTLWSPRRFTFGGRRFVWKPDPARKKSGAEVLYEVQSEWNTSGSKTGKIEDKVFDTKLAWTSSDKVIGHTRVEMVGGLDRLLREFLFASQSAKAMIYRYGHMGEE